MIFNSRQGRLQGIKGMTASDALPHYKAEARKRQGAGGKGVEKIPLFEEGKAREDQPL